MPPAAHSFRERRGARRRFLERALLRRHRSSSTSSLCSVAAALCSPAAIPPEKKLGLIKFATAADYCLVCFSIAIAITRGITIIIIIIIIIIVYHLLFFCRESAFSTILKEGHHCISDFAMYAPASCRHALEQCLELGSRMLSSSY